MHLYTALDNRIFDKYGIATEHVVLRGGAVAMAALASDEIQFLYCNADINVVRIATGADGKLVASPLLGLPYVLLALRDIQTPADLKGKSVGITRAGDFTYRLGSAVLKTFQSDRARGNVAPVGRDTHGALYRVTAGYCPSHAYPAPSGRAGKEGWLQRDLLSRRP